MDVILAAQERPRQGTFHCDLRKERSRARAARSIGEIAHFMSLHGRQSRCADYLTTEVWNQRAPYLGVLYLAGAVGQANPEVELRTK